MKKGFTLIELIIVVIIIGILATIAVPQYLKAVARAKGAKAKVAIGLIAQAEKMYRASDETYWEGAIAAGTPLETHIELSDVVADSDWTYAVANNGDITQNYIITATKVGAPGAGLFITLTSTGTWTVDLAFQ